MPTAAAVAVTAKMTAAVVARDVTHCVVCGILVWQY